MKSTLIILTRNEIEGVKALYDRIPFDQVDEAFVVDGGSTDGTVEFFESRGIRVIPQETKGRGEAFRIGMREAKEDNLVFFSPDGNEDPADILRLLKLLEEGYDMVIASRFKKGGRTDDADEFIAHRALGNRFFTKVANLLGGGSITDSLNGFRTIKKEKLKALKLDAHGYGIEFQMSIRALRLGYRIGEIHTYEGDRIGGQSGAKSLDTGLYLIKLIFRELLIGKNF